MEQTTATASTTPLQRANTLPVKLPKRTTRYSLGSFDSSTLPSNDLLFFHPSAKIVKFQVPESPHTTTTASTSSLPEFDYPVDAIETLPWRSLTERTTALGPLKIEHVAGSTAFLKSGSVVQALLKGCQSWCVDGECVFVLRIRRLTYYRIELPNEFDEDKNRVEDLKRVLPTIIKYESTPCPFKRGFSVELPKEAITPRRKRAWQPKHDVNYKPRAMSFSEGSLDTELRDLSDRGSLIEDTDGDTTDGSKTTPKPPRRRALVYPSSAPKSIPARPASRNYTEPLPPVDFLVAKFQTLPESDNEADIDSPVSSSIGSSQSFHTSTSAGPSPSRSHPNLSVAAKRGPNTDHQQSPSTTNWNGVKSEVIGTIGDEQYSHLKPWEMRESKSHPPANEPASLATGNTNNGSSSGNVDLQASEPNSSVRRRVRESRKRELSPLPPSSTLIVPSPKPPTNTVPRSILQTTCTYVLGPPLHLLLVFIHLATRIVAAGEADPATDITDSRYHCDIPESDDASSEDDFGIPLSKTNSFMNKDKESEYPNIDPWANFD